MYDGFSVYKTYLAVKLHFTSPTYDYHKYEGRSMQNWIHLQVGTIGIFFTSLVKSIKRMRLSISS